MTKFNLPTWSYPRNDIAVEVPDEAEVLDFANAVRAAGGANILEALLPSTPSDAKSCLIANALNFSCRIMGLYEVHNGLPYEGKKVLESDGTTAWGMHFPANMNKEQAQHIADTLNLKLYNVPTGLAMQIPVRIRNAALAFDRGIAFRDYNVEQLETI